jgi:hypothetical protein
MKQWKPFLILILLLIILLYTKHKLYLDNFTNKTHDLYTTDGSLVTEAPNLTNIILKINDTENRKVEDTGFYNLYSNFGKNYFRIQEYLNNNNIPQLIIQTYDSCPIMNNLFNEFPKINTDYTTIYEKKIERLINSIKSDNITHVNKTTILEYIKGTLKSNIENITKNDSLDSAQITIRINSEIVLFGTKLEELPEGTISEQTKTKYKNILKFDVNEKLQNETATGLRFKHDLEKVFFNINEDTEIDFPILDIGIYDKKPESQVDIVPQLYFGIKPIVKGGSNFQNSLLVYQKYVSPQLDFSNAQSSFGVKQDFSNIDIYRFMDFCYTALCWGALHIRLLKPIDNHYYAFPCQNQHCNNNDTNKNSYFYLLPVRIRQICYDENAEYTRAKCNRCSSNIIVFFNQLPKKFRNIKGHEPYIHQSPPLNLL